MTTATIPSPPQTHSDPPRDMSVVSERGGEWRVVFRGVDWETYSKLVDSCGESSAIKLTFDGQDLEIMTVGNEHEFYKETLSTIVREICIEFSIEFWTCGETTWKRPEIERGLEADQSYYFSEEKRIAARASHANRSNRVADYPNPDLAIEIDLSASKVDRPGIYAALKVPEIWRFDGETLIIERLNDDGIYVAVERSGFLPIEVQDILPWLLKESFTGELARIKKIRAWIRDELIPRAGGPK